MQTFLPYPSFKASAECLDTQRLGKQRVEVLQLLKGQWSNHPCARMWYPYRHLLAAYGVAIINEWVGRGFTNNIDLLPYTSANGASVAEPPWLGDTAFHDSHKSNLLRKFPEYYSRYGWSVPDNLPYVWPSM